MALLAVAAYVATHQRATTEFQSTDDFLASARKARRRRPGDGAEAGFIPGTSEKGGIPKIELPMATLDLGVVSHAKTTVVDFPIKNAGTGTLIISDIGTTCHCTEGAMADGQNVIKPGKTRHHEGILASPSGSPMGSPRTNSYRCAATTHGSPLSTLDVLSKVDPEFSVEPDTLAFGEVAKGASGFENSPRPPSQRQPFEVTGVVPSHPEDEKKLELSFEKLPASEWAKADHVEYNVKVTLPASLRPAVSLPESRFRTPAHGRTSRTSTCRFRRRSRRSTAVDTEADHSGVGRKTGQTRHRLFYHRSGQAPLR